MPSIRANPRRRRPMIGLIKRLLALPHRTFRITFRTLSGAADRRQIDFLPIAGLQCETQALILFSLRENATSSEVPDWFLGACQAVPVLCTVISGMQGSLFASCAVSSRPSSAVVASAGGGARRAVACSCADRPNHTEQVCRTQMHRVMMRITAGSSLSRIESMHQRFQPLLPRCAGARVQCSLIAGMLVLVRRATCNGVACAEC